MKKKLSIIIVSVMVIFVSAVLFINSKKYDNEILDRLNPLLEKEIGYAILPVNVTYNNGETYDEEKAKNREGYQIPDDYTTLVIDSPDEEDRNVLTFSGGQSPNGKNYAKVTHKGLYVYKIEFISWDEIPEDIQNSFEKSNIN